MPPSNEEATQIVIEISGNDGNGIDMLKRLKKKAVEKGFIRPRGCGKAPSQPRVPFLITSFFLA